MTESNPNQVTFKVQRYDPENGTPPGSRLNENRIIVRRYIPRNATYRERTMASTVDELTITYSENGKDIVKELDKEILSKGAWTTILFRYQEWSRSKEEYGPEKYTIRRYQKRAGEYTQKSKFNISSKDQAQRLIAALQKWIGE